MAEHILTPSPLVPAGRGPASHGDKDRSRGIFFIAVFDLAKALFFAVAAAGVFHMVARDTHVELTRLLHTFRINGDHAFVQDLLQKANLFTDSKKRVATLVLLLYTVLYAVEGIGLLLGKRWAEYFAVVITAVPLPFEAWTLWHQATLPGTTHSFSLVRRLVMLLHNEVFVLKIVVLLVNVGIIWYLVHHLRLSRRRQ